MLIQAAPIFLAAVLGMVTVMFTGVLRPDQAYAGFAKEFILLIVAAFLVARAVIRSGLGRRIAFHVIRRLGRSTLGLGYSVMITDAIIAPAFPSNTARSGVLYPIVHAICLGSGSSPDDGTEKKLGNFMMIIGMASLTVSSALWLTAMATNPVGATIALEFGVEVGFASWFLAAVVPALSALVVLPMILLPLVNPETKHTPEAPVAADAAEQTEIWQAMKQLPERAQYIMKLRFIEGRTLEETGKLLKLTRARIKQIQDASLKRIRQLLGGRGTRPGV